MIDIVKFLNFEEKMAEERRNDLEHEDHSEYWNERYWHGYGAAIRRVIQWIDSVEFILSTKGRNDDV